MRSKFLVLLFFFFIQSCGRDNTSHIAALKEIDENTRYMLYKKLNDPNAPPIKRGVLGHNFYNCLQSTEIEFFPGAVKEQYLLVLDGKKKKIYYRLRVTDSRVYTVHRVVGSRTYKDDGVKESALIKTRCTLDDI